MHRPAMLAMIAAFAFTSPIRAASLEQTDVSATVGLGERSVHVYDDVNKTMDAVNGYEAGQSNDATSSSLITYFATMSCLTDLRDSAKILEGSLGELSSVLSLTQSARDSYDRENGLLFSKFAIRTINSSISLAHVELDSSREHCKNRQLMEPRENEFASLVSDTESLVAKLSAEIGD
jgi:hypothetical protein